MDHFLEGMEGYAMLVLTNFGPKGGKPWSPEGVKIFLDKVRGEMERGWHTYFVLKRVSTIFPHKSASEAKA